MVFSRMLACAPPTTAIPTPDPSSSLLRSTVALTFAPFSRISRSAFRKMSLSSIQPFSLENAPLPSWTKPRSQAHREACFHVLLRVLQGPKYRRDWLPIFRCDKLAQYAPEIDRDADQQIVDMIGNHHYSLGLSDQADRGHLQRREAVLLDKC